MFKNLEVYLIDLIKGKEKGFRAKLVLLVLSFLEYVYLLIINLRKIFYSCGIIKRVGFDTTIISIGNITVGGTGKTPIVKLLAGELNSLGKKIVVVSRGYKSETAGSVIVSDGEKLLKDVRIAGDEAYMLAEGLEGVPIVIGKDRVSACRLAVNSFKPDIILLDDGFQHWRVKRDYDIVLIDAYQPFGFKHLLPRGFLREPMENLSRADQLILTKTAGFSQKELANIKKELKIYNQKSKVYLSYYKGVGLRFYLPPKGVIEDFSSIASKRILAISGIANPSSFLSTLKESGLKAFNSLIFSDHYQYTMTDFERIAEIIKSEGIELIITTEKDAVKFSREMLKIINDINCELAAIMIKPVINNQKDLLGKILN